MNNKAYGLQPRFYGDWKIKKFNMDQQVIVINSIGEYWMLSTCHVKKVTNDKIIFILHYSIPRWED